eukprot:gene4168-14268_t
MELNGVTSSHLDRLFDVTDLDRCGGVELRAHDQAMGDYQQGSPHNSKLNSVAMAMACTIPGKGPTRTPDYPDYLIRDIHVIADNRPPPRDDVPLIRKINTMIAATLHRAPLLSYRANSSSSCTRFNPDAIRCQRLRGTQSSAATSSAPVAFSPATPVATHAAPSAPAAPAPAPTPIIALLSPAGAYINAATQGASKAAAPPWKIFMQG